MYYSSRRAQVVVSIVSLWMDAERSAERSCLLLVFVCISTVMGCESAFVGAAVVNGVYG